MNISLRQSFLLLLCCLCLCSPALKAKPQDSVKAIPAKREGRIQTIDVKHIALNLRFDWKKKRASGKATITLAPLFSGKQITLDAGMLTIHAITLADGTPLQFTYDGGDRDNGLAITLQREYKAGEELTLKIDYQTNWVNKTDPNNVGGSNGKGLRFFEATFSEPARRKQIWSMGEPESNRYWFPCYDYPNDLRTTEFTARVDAGLVAISNGRLVDSITNADGSRTFHWNTDSPYANYKTSFVVGKYVDIRQNYQDIGLHSWSYPDEAEAARASIERLPDMVKFFSGLTGVKYPYPSYSQIFVQEMPWGVANMMLATQTENMVDDKGTHADFLYLWDGLEAEGLASQWFGNYISCNNWSEVWLNRGFAHYFDALYAEYKNGHEEFLLWQMQSDHSTYLADWNAGYRHPIITANFDDVIAFTGDNYAYSAGASVLHMLRKQIGEEQWQKVIRHYVKSNSGKTVTTKDFQKSITEITGDSMDWFFTQWLYQMGHPIFEVTRNYNASTKKLTLYVKQTQERDSRNLYPQTDFFKGKVDLEIDGVVMTVWLEAKAMNEFVFDANNEPKLINFDYESAWLKELKFEKPVDELIYQFQYDKDVTGMQWAMAELVRLVKSDKVSGLSKDRIYEAFRKVITGNTYWRVRYNAIQQLQSLMVPVIQGQAVTLDKPAVDMLLHIIAHEKAWMRAAAIRFLGMAKKPAYADLYLKYLDDESDRVINSAAIALGKTKSAKAWNALVTLKDKPSWKNQSLISALNGMKELGDQRGAAIAFQALSDLHAPRWTLVTPIWDFRIAAAETLTALGKGDTAYPMIFDRLSKSIEQHDIHDIASNTQLIATLADPRGQEAFGLLKLKFKDDNDAMAMIQQYETQFKNAIKNQKP